MRIRMRGEVTPDSLTAAFEALKAEICGAMNVVEGFWDANIYLHVVTAQGDTLDFEDKNKFVDIDLSHMGRTRPKQLVKLVSQSSRAQSSHSYARAGSA